MRSQRLLFPFVAVLTLGCGGAIEGANGDRDGGNNNGDGAVINDGGTRDGWGQCTAPGGYAICGNSATQCSAESSNNPACKGCADFISKPANPANDLAFCSGPDVEWIDPDAGINSARFCRDGYVLVAAPASSYNFFPDGGPAGEHYDRCVRFEIAQLYAKNGWAKAARYTDFSHFTGDPLPTSSSCPQVSGIQLCGGSCGDSCPAGTHCTGRSPGHAFSVCVPEPSQDWCSDNGARGDQGWGCFAFSVPPEDKTIVQTISYCVPANWCHAAAAGLPGGGMCDVYTAPRGCFQ